MPGAHYESDCQFGHECIQIVIEGTPKHKQLKVESSNENLAKAKEIAGICCNNL